MQSPGHIKALEETLGIALFDRTVRGMSLTPDGERLLAKAEQTLGSHREFLEEATRIKGRLTGKLRLGAGSNSTSAAIGRLIAELALRHPDVEPILTHHNSTAGILEGLRAGALDAGFYNEPGEPDNDLTTIEVGRFRIYLAAPPGMEIGRDPVDWHALEELPWILPEAHTCCGSAAEDLFLRHQFRPRRIIGVDREAVTRTLIAGGVGVGMLHTENARDAEAKGEVNLVCEARQAVRVLFAHQSSRAQDPFLSAAAAILVAT